MKEGKAAARHYDECCRRACKGHKYGGPTAHVAKVSRTALVSLPDAEKSKVPGDADVFWATLASYLRLLLVELEDKVVLWRFRHPHQRGVTARLQFHLA